MDIDSVLDSCQNYLHWQQTDQQQLEKIHSLLKEIQRAPFEGSGMSEALNYNLKEYWSRRITLEQRLVYRIHNNQIRVGQCRYYQVESLEILQCLFSCYLNIIMNALNSLGRAGFVRDTDYKSAQTENTIDLKKSIYWPKTNLRKVIKW